MVTWSLTLSGVTKTLAEWGISGVELALASLTSDQLTFIKPRQRFDDDDLCAFGAECILTRTEGASSEVWFRGIRQLSVGSAGPSSESQTYLFQGPWRWLEENQFQQPWGVEQIYTDHVILNQNIGQDIKLVLDYAIANGAELQYVLGELTALAAFPPADEITGQMAAEVIRSRLQFAPDAIHWVDYTTQPPTLHFQKRGSLPVGNVRIASHTSNASYPVARSVSLRPRPDLQVPSVKINGETIETVNDIQYILPSVDVYPPGSTGREDGALNATIVLQGNTTSNLFAEIECQDIVAQSTALGFEWFKQHIHTLRDTRVTLLQIENIERVDENGAAIFNPLPRELIEGQIADWMGVEYQTEIIRCRISYQVFDATGVEIEYHYQKLFAFEIVTTDAPAGITPYSITNSVEIGDPSIIGLAQYLYEALSTLHYDGSVTIEEAECTGLITLGQRLNLLGSRAEYADMLALIQQVSYSIDAGITSITIGPPRHLTISDILTLLQRFRQRRRWTNPSTQEDGEISGTGSTLELGKAVPNTNAIAGNGVKELEVIKDSVTKITSSARDGFLKLEGAANLGTVTIALSNTVSGQPAAVRHLTIREINVCVAGSPNRTGKMLVLASDIYNIV